MKPSFKIKNAIAMTLMSGLLVGCGATTDDVIDSADKVAENTTNTSNTDTNKQPASNTATSPSTSTDTASYVTLDAATDTSKAAYLDLSSGHSVNETDKWHLAYQKYVGFKTNGGSNGSGGVSACVAKEYPQLFDSSDKAVQAEFEKLTKDTTLDDFKAVNKTSCTNFIEDSIKTQIKTSDWLDASYGGGGPSFSAKTDASNGWMLRSATKDSGSGNYAYARFKVKTVNVTLGATPVRQVTLSYEKWNYATTSFDAATDSVVIDFSDGSQKHWDLETNTIVSATDAWDLSIKKEGQDYMIQVNGGASGKGYAGIGMVLSSVSGGVSGVTDPANTSQVYKYFGDSAVGAMAEPGSHGALQYSVAGKHKMWPTFPVYLFKDGDKYYKAQVVSNYGSEGSSPSATIYLRYAEVTE